MKVFEDCGSLIARITQNDYTTVMESRFFQQGLTVKTHLSRTVAFLCATALLHYFFLESVSQQKWVIEKPLQSTLPINLKLNQPDTKVAVAEPISKKKVPPKHTDPGKHGRIKETSREDKPPVEEESQASTVIEESPLPSKTDEAEKSETPFTLRLPPPAEMRMEVSYTKANGSPTNGIGNLSWNTDGTSYSATLEVGVDLMLTTINLLQINSEGSIASDGLAPKISTDTRRNRAATAIHFKHEDKSITFSSSNKTIAMENGAQDALSVLMQLAAIGNSDAKRLSTGTTLSIQVAEGRDAQVFVFEVLGEEVIDSKLGEGGKLHSIHLIRPPRPGSYNSTLEVWLAPEKSWYPVRIKNTESSGTVTIQNVTEIVQRRVLAQ